MLHVNLKESAICLLTLLLTLILSCCKQTNTEIMPSSDFAPYVNAFTGGIVSQVSPIRIELAKDLPVVELNSEVTGNPIIFSPSLKGKSYWVSSNTIEFVPEKGELKSGTLYQATFKLGDYVEVEKELHKFNFSFRVIERNFTFDIGSFLVQASDPEMVTINGKVRFSDVVDKEKVDKMITVWTSNRQKLTASVMATDNPTVFIFSIDNIKKGDCNETLYVKVNGKTLDIDNEITKEIKIPAKDCLVFMGANLIAAPENGIRITFSEALLTPQDLKGLIEVEGVRTTFQINENIVNIYFEEALHSDLKLNLFAGIKGASGRSLEENSTIVLTPESLKPQVKLMTKGTILPDSKNLILPFQAVGLRAVDLHVVRIYESNVLSFLQVNSINSSSELRRVGRLVCKKTLQLDEDPLKRLDRWENYSVDLSLLIRQEPGAIYRIMFSFKQDYSTYSCNGGATTNLDNASLTQLTLPDEEDSVWDTPQSYYDMEYEGYDWQLYDWRQVNNPCHPSYYMNASRKVSCNLFATNLGVVVKRNSGNKLWVAVSDILTTEPVSRVDLSVYNYQLKLIGTARTEQDGFAVIDSKGVPFMVVASDGKQKTYVRVVNGEDNSTSRFDVGGKEVKKGLKGFIYGERGVWRPGDTLHLSFILEDHEKRIPSKHPVSIELFNPRGQFYDKQVSTNGLNGFYAFHIPTKQGDPTGTWNAYVKVGGAAFHKSLRIETVKPNRLKIDVALSDDVIKAEKGDVQAVLSSSWLTGAVASNLKAKVEMTLSKVYTQFKDYDQYIFNNPATDFSGNSIEVFDGVLNSEGNVKFALKLPQASNAPGLLRANITARVFEPGGDVSINTKSVPFSPFESYVGINLNQPTDKSIETDQNHVFDVITVDADGKRTGRTDLEYKIYRVDWSWWWDKRSESFDSYINNTSIIPKATGVLQTVNGKAKFSFRVDYPEWGRYLVYVKDRKSGHATGGTVYIDWPESRGRSQKIDPSGITMLSFSLDKKSYEVGETVTAIIPASSDGRALIAIENGSTVVHREWVKVSSTEDTKYQFTVTSEMSPNVYLHISLLQPHAQTINNLPIRMYGVMPVFVNNKETVLEPQIRMNNVLRPEEQFTVAVSEKSGRSMTYTVAIVDDGLLDLTNFKTPNPWNEFYSREALGIRTWDMFDDVIGAYTASFGALFSTGGDEMLKVTDTKANRFRSIVKYLGPFELKKGEVNTHTFQLPMYVGSVRAMVVAGANGAYGSVEKTTPVRSPLMVLSTLPRVLSINEEIWLPVNVFAMESGVKDVTVSVESSSNVKLTDGNRKSISFAQPGDRMVYFKIKTGIATGVEIIKIKATGGGISTHETIEIDVRNPNPTVTFSESKVLLPNASEDLNYKLSGNAKENWVNLELSRMPSVDFSRRLDYLNNYAHYCTEQISSKAFPLLFVSAFKDVDKVDQAQIKRDVQEAIRQLYARQHSNGGFVYWPGDASENEWVTTFAGTFLLMAQEKGYEVNKNVLTKWSKYQQSMARNWRAVSRASTWQCWQSDLQQAYRLYSLALGGLPELGAMNRMKEVKDLTVQAQWRLAAAYAINGKVDVGNELVFNAKTTIEPYSSNNLVYGSSYRDEAMILETLVLLGREKEALPVAKKVSENLSGEQTFNTQSTAYALLAMGRLAEKYDGFIDATWSLNGNEQAPVKSARVMYQASLPTTPLSGKVTVKNNGSGALYVDLISHTQLQNDTLPAMANNLRLTVRYTDMSGKNIHVGKLKQGTDFMAVVKVENISGAFDYQDIAMTHIVPSGWEIYNEEFLRSSAKTSEVSKTYSYRDIRDDRVLTYFDLKRNQSKEFRVRLQATYAGDFTLPAIHCEVMYEPTVQARTQAARITVER